MNRPLLMLFFNVYPQFRQQSCKKYFVFSFTLFRATHRALHCALHCAFRCALRCALHCALRAGKSQQNTPVESPLNYDDVAGPLKCSPPLHESLQKHHKTLVQGQRTAPLALPLDAAVIAEYHIAGHDGNGCSDGNYDVDRPADQYQTVNRLEPENVAAVRIRKVRTAHVSHLAVRTRSRKLRESM